MTDARLKRLNGAIERAMRLARAECSSNRLQNCLSAAIVIVRKEIKSKRIKEIKSKKVKEIKSIKSKQFKK